MEEYTYLFKQEDNGLITGFRDANGVGDRTHNKLSLEL